MNEYNEFNIENEDDKQQGKKGRTSRTIVDDDDSELFSYLILCYASLPLVYYYAR